MNKYYKTSSLLLLILTFLTASPSHATMELNGIATYTHLSKDQFIAGLYSDPVSTNAREILLNNGRKRMEIKVLARNLLSRRFKRMWIEGIAINAGTNELEKHAQNVADFSNLLKPRLKKDDVLIITRSPRYGVDITVNGIKLGTIEDPRFFDLLLRTWIGPVPPSRTFREALLQGGKIDPTLLAMYQKISPAPERAEAIRLALNATKKPKPKPVEPPPAEEIATEEGSEDTLVEGAEGEETSEELAAIDGEATEGALEGQSEGDIATETTEELEEESTTEQLLAAPDLDSLDEPAITDASPEETEGDGEALAEGEEEEEDTEEYSAANLLAEQLYFSKLIRWTRGYTEYPRKAIRRNQQGTVRVSVTIGREGEVQVVDLEEASRFKLLNRAAEKTIKRAAPFPPIPEAISGDSYQFTVPVVFALRER